MYVLEVLDPVAVTGGYDKLAKPAPRPSSLEGLTIGLVWNAKRGGREALEKAGEIISSRYSGVRLCLYCGTQPCKRDLLEQVEKECDVVIGSTGD